ncbi:unnamed protein product [Ranitomeya imitator]|uniref:WD repeat and FYVE domain-containing protein 3 n=1 Tax=Ranitomeya imitator TaxID=111125 RepID=A0ABN9KRH5_9NEOB|nr:unnamed protein product [Ranitomeya imitator]
MADVTTYMVSCSMCYMFTDRPEEELNFTCQKCRLVALLEEKVRGLEERIATLKLIKENEDFLDRTEASLVVTEGEKSVREPPKADEWKHVTKRSKKTMEKSPTTQLKNRYQIFVEDEDGTPKDEAIPASKKEKGTQQQVTAKSTAKKQRRVVVVGDSLLRGTEAAICRPDITAREVCCLPGAMIKDVTDRIPKLFNSKDVHPFLLIHVGTNDTARKDLPTICKDFEELGKKVKELDAQRRTTPQQTWETHIRQKTRYTHQEGVKLEEEGTGRKTLDLNKEDPGKHTQKGGKNISKTIHSEEIGTKQNPLNCMLANARSLTNKMEELEAEISTGFLRDVILDYLNENNCLTPYQHGFMRNRSCQTNLISFYEEDSPEEEMGRRYFLITFFSDLHVYHTVSTSSLMPPKNIGDLKSHGGPASFPNSDAVIIHPGAMLSMLDLLAAVDSDSQPEHALDLQLAIANILQSLVHTERNQQVMCEGGLHARLLHRCSAALADEDHALHPPLQRMFERLASQALEPMVLREFLRLGNPLNCAAWDKRLLKQYRVHKPSSLSYEPEMRSSMIMSTEGLGCDSVFCVGEDKHYRISRSLVKSAEGCTVPLTRVKCLVSMTTPHDIRLHGSSVTPAFVEFDTSLEGFGCLFLPSLAPHNAPNSNAVTTGLMDGTVLSGIGTGEHLFPPPSGLSYSTWFCIEHFSTPPNNHPVRLLTIVRRATSSEQHYVCLAIVLSAKDKSLIVSTKEELLQNYVDDFSEESSFYEILPCCARFRCSELIMEGQWHHLVLVMSKGMLKNSTATLYLDGQLVSTVKLHYVHSTPGGSGSANPPVVSTVYSYIGTPPAQRQLSSLVWRLGPTHFLEEVLTAASVGVIYELGPNYVGSFQAVCSPCKDSKSESGTPSLVSLVPEEKVSFGLYALSVSSLTVARIRKVYNKLDSKAIAKQLAISSHENATPVKLLHNSAGHLNGPARTIGAALIGYLGVRTFVPKPVATTLQYIGGAAAILGLVAMASDVEGLYAAVKALVCVVKSNPLASKEMERIKGYQLLAMLLKKKRGLLNSHILHLTFSLVGTVDSGHETSIIPNSTAFQDLLCDFEVWLHAPYELHLSLFEHFIELLTESSEAAKNAKLMREFQLIPKLLLTLRDMSLSQPTISAISNVLSYLLQGFPNNNDLLRIDAKRFAGSGPLATSETCGRPMGRSHENRFLTDCVHGLDSSSHHTLPTFAVCEKFVVMEVNNEEKLEPGTEDDFGGLVSANLILLRNRLLDMLLKLLYTTKEKTTVNLQACEELVKTLGFDWVIMFMEEHLHSTTVTAAMRILVVLLSNQPILIKFKEGVSGGGWLDQTDSVLTNKIGTVLVLSDTVRYLKVSVSDSIGRYPKNIGYRRYRYPIPIQVNGTSSIGSTSHDKINVIQKYNSSHKEKLALTWLCQQKSYVQTSVARRCVGDATHDAHKRGKTHAKTLRFVTRFNVGRSAGGRSTVREINRDACHFPGFPVLQSLLPKHTNVPALYFLLMALFLQQPVTELPENLQVSAPVASSRSNRGCQFDLDSIWTFIFGVPASSGNVFSSIHNVCTEAALLLLGMLRTMLNSPWQSEEEGSWLREYPVTLMQFFRYLYHNVPDLAPMWMSPDFLCALVATVFPFNIRPYSEMISPRCILKDEKKRLDYTHPGAVRVRWASRSGSSASYLLIMTSSSCLHAAAPAPTHCSTLLCLHQGRQSTPAPESQQLDEKRTSSNEDRKPRTATPIGPRPQRERPWVTDLDDEGGSPAEEFKAFASDSGMNRSQSEYCNVGSKTYLTSHPAKKFVFDFMRVLVIENLCLTPASKQTPLIDLLLEATPERSTRAQQKEFQTYILDSVMDHLLAADVLLGVTLRSEGAVTWLVHALSLNVSAEDGAAPEQSQVNIESIGGLSDGEVSEDASLPVTTGGSYQVLVNNVFYFTQRVVDKLWQGMFNKDSKMVVDCIIQLISQSKRRSQSVSLEAIYNCLNRTVLYQFSRAHKTVPQQVALLDSLRVLTVNRNLMLGPGNHDQDFIACLAHCLINLHMGSTRHGKTNGAVQKYNSSHKKQALACNPDGFGLEAEARMTTWHIMMPSEVEPDGIYQDVSEGRQLLLKAVNRVWIELIHSKKQVLEDMFKVTFPVNERGHVDIAVVRPFIEEATLRAWQNHLALSVMCYACIYLITKEISQWIFTHIAVVRDLVDMQYKENQERQQNALKYVIEEWNQIEYELLRERGLWGPPIGSHLDKWLLEMTEGPCRMRKKVVRNDMFYIHYPYIPEMEQDTNTLSDFPCILPESSDGVFTVSLEQPALTQCKEAQRQGTDTGIEDIAESVSHTPIQRCLREILR